MLATQPFFANLSLRLPVQADPSRRTIASDGERLYFNPQWVAEALDDDIKTCIANLVTACALKHHTRRGERDYAKWQRASYRVCLPYLLSENLANSHDAMHALDMSVEKAYEIIDDPEDDDDSQDENPQAGPSAMSALMQGQGDGESSGEGGGQGDGKPESKDPDGKGEIMDFPEKHEPSLSQDEKESARNEAAQDWDEAGAQAAQFSKAEGKQPGQLVDDLQAKYTQQADWKTLLRRYMFAQAHSDWSWRIPNYRYAALGIHVPSLISEGMGRIVLAIDTSGSLDNETLAEFWGEIQGIANELNPESVHVIQCDTRVTSVEEYHPTDLPGTLEAHGRGGTMFSPVFEYLDEEGDAPPACMIYFTDMYCGDFGDEPDFPVLWAVEPDGDREAEPPFGEVIQLARG